MSGPNVVQYEPIGLIRTPYQADGFCPYQPVEREEGEACIELYPEYQEGLDGLEHFTYLYVLYHLHMTPEGKAPMKVMPPWARGVKTGLFATRMERRPVPIGLSIVKIKRIENHKIFTSLVDVFDQTPLLDVKPYILDLDAKPDANLGWIGDIDGYQHLLDHIRGIPHRHSHHHDEK